MLMDISHRGAKHPTYEEICPAPDLCNQKEASSRHSKLWEQEARKLCDSNEALLGELADALMHAETHRRCCNIFEQDSHLQTSMT